MRMRVARIKSSLAPLIQGSCQTHPRHKARLCRCCSASTPIDHLDFASPVSGLGSKMGIDATNKWPGETSREWGRPMQMTPEVTAKVEQMWQPLRL